MAVATATIDAFPTYTDDQFLKAVRKAIVDVTLGGTSTAIEGHSVTREDLPNLWALATALEDRINSEGNGGNIALARFGQV